MKAIFVTVLFSLPVLTIIGYVPIILLSNIYYVNSGLNQLVNFILQLLIVTLVILNLLYNVALLIWFCWLRRRGVAGVMVMMQRLLINYSCVLYTVISGSCYTV